MKTLLDLLHEANAIEIDCTLCENYYLESEEEGDDVTALEISYEEDGNLYEHFITFKEISLAEYKNGSWHVPFNNGEWSGNTCKIVPYKLTEIKA